MAENSKIEWCHHTDNLWQGCSKVHAGCDHCYAETLAHRWGNDIWGNDKPRKMTKSAFPDLDKFQKIAAASGETHRVFVGSMMDIFEKPMPLIDSEGSEVAGITTENLRSDFFERIHKGRYPNLLFLLLTKRPSNIIKYIPVSWRTNAPSNVMFGTSISDQKSADTLFPQLMGEAGYKFLSVEPQIGAVSLSRLFHEYGVPNWVIQGGESGHHKRPFDIEWAHSMRTECHQWNVPYFFKQIDKVQEIPVDLLIRQFPNTK